jgi:uncharacterized protein
MKCPRCQVDLAISDRQAIEIDFCPQCRGVWLDRGELDKIIERSSHFRDDDDDGDDGRRRSSERRGEYDRGDYDRDRYERDRYQKRKSFWTELFD